jgi:hypothetical protein
MYLFSDLSKILVILFRVLVVLSVLILVTVNGFTVSAQTQTDSNEPTTNTLSTIFPACKFADTGVASFLECASQITFFILVVAIIYAFLKLAYMAINGLLFAGGVSSDFYKMIGESLRNLVVGILFVGMPVTILTAIDPLTRIINFRFLEEFNLGPEARLIEPGEKGLGGRAKAKGCNGFGFMSCVVACANSIDKSTCVDTCKNQYSGCQSCFQFVNDRGEIDKRGFQECIAPSSSVPSGGVGGGNLNYNGSILSCGNNRAITDSNGFVRLAYTPYISQNKQPNGQLAPAPSQYRNNGCGGASSLMIVEMARPGTFPCLDNQKLPNFSGDQDHYCLYTYFWQNANYQFVAMDSIKSNMMNNTNNSCQGAFGITSMKNCDQSYHTGRKKFLEYFGLTTESVGSSAQYFQAIKDNINQGLPLFISINFTPQSSHIMVIVGYKEGSPRQILLNDPWQFDNTWGSSRLMIVTLSQDNTKISGYRYSAYPTPSIGYIEKVRKMSGFAPVQCDPA